MSVYTTCRPRAIRVVRRRYGGVTRLLDRGPRPARAPVPGLIPAWVIVPPTPALQPESLRCGAVLACKPIHSERGRFCPLAVTILGLTRTAASAADRLAWLFAPE